MTPIVIYVLLLSYFCYSFSCCTYFLDYYLCFPNMKMVLVINSTNCITSLFIVLLVNCSISITDIMEHPLNKHIGAILHLLLTRLESFISMHWLFSCIICELALTPSISPLLLTWSRMKLLYADIYISCLSYFLFFNFYWECRSCKNDV